MLHFATASDKGDKLKDDIRLTAGLHMLFKTKKKKKMNEIYFFLYLYRMFQGC